MLAFRPWLREFTEFFFQKGNALNLAIAACRPLERLAQVSVAGRDAFTYCLVRWHSFRAMAQDLLLKPAPCLLRGLAVLGLDHPRPDY